MSAPELWHSTTFARTCLGISASRFAELVQSGVITKAAFGKFDPEVYFQEYLAWRFKTDKDSPRANIERQKSRKLTRENAVAEGKLVPIDKLKRITEDMALALVVGLKSLPGRIASLAAGQPAAVIQELVRGECAHIQRAIAAAASGRDDAGAVAEDDEDSGGDSGEAADAEAHPPAKRLGRPNKGAAARER